MQTGILAHNSLSPQATWKGSADPKPHCSGTYALFLGGLRWTQWSWNTVRPEQAQDAWITHRGPLENPGNTH